MLRNSFKSLSGGGFGVFRRSVVGLSFLFRFLCHAGVLPLQLMMMHCVSADSAILELINDPLVGNVQVLWVVLEIHDMVGLGTIK